MAKSIHKGAGLNNVSETWDENERKLESGNAAGDAGYANSDVPAASELDRIVRDEATEYDNENKENRLLGGDRASVNDDAGADDEA